MEKLKCCRPGCTNRVYSMLMDVEDDTVYEDPVEPVPVCAEHLIDYMATHGGMSSNRCDEYGNDTRSLDLEALLKEEDRLAIAKATGFVRHD